MLPRTAMLTIKNRGGRVPAGAPGLGALISSNAGRLALLLALLAGCMPPGPRALRDGKRLMEEGKYPQAIEELKAATRLLGGTNALAWNYLGLAYHHAGELGDAERAYQRALALNHDLSEARFNLGCVWLAQNKLEAAKAEFTACTLRRPNGVEGFLKLGSVELRLREPSAAEKTFSDALRLSPHDPEAWNGLGLARLPRGRAAEAAQCFEAALKQQPDYRPALLNLAIVSQEYLKDRQLALTTYRQYLALKPPPPNAEALAATVRQLEQELAPPKPVVTNVTRVASAPRPEPAAATPKPAPVHPARPVATNVPKAAPAPAPAPASAPTSSPEVVQVAAEPALKPAQDTPTPPETTPASAAEPGATTSSAPASAAGPKTAKRGFFQRINPMNLFRSGERPAERPKTLDLTAGSSAGAASPPTASADDTATSPAPASAGGPGARYAYRSPAQPVAGNRADAERLFAQGVQAYQDHRLAEAMQSYRLAIRADPTLFEAHYNLGLAAAQAGDLPAALAAYEDALAARPTSLDARYNFALVLEQANHPVDAARQLEQVLAVYPNYARAHLALGNLYVQFGQPAKARQHYLRVLEADPHNPQAGAIRYWLAAHPS